MAYCKTKTYMNLKRLADRAYVRAVETQTTDDWELFEEYEMECADYALQYENEIDWDNLDD